MKRTSASANIWHIRTKRIDEEEQRRQGEGGKAKKVERRENNKRNRTSFPFAEEARREPRNADSTNRSVPLEARADGGGSGWRRPGGSSWG